VFPVDMPARVLIVDDNEDIRRANTELLQALGYDAEAVEDGCVAWERLQACSYDLLITDYDMPKMTGVELLKQVRAARMELPVILMSGTMPTEELKQLSCGQFDATLIKPFLLAELLQAVEQALHSRMIPG
jgi:CheY-like chemotaxis protein